MSATSVTTEAVWNAERTSAAAAAPRIVPVLVKGNERTYELRGRLSAAGLHWVKDAKVWSGDVPDYFIPQMVAEGLPVVPVVPEGDPLDRFRESLVEKAPEPLSPRAPAHKPKACARKEAPVKASAQEQAAGFLQEHNWDDRDITANLSDDDRASDEHRVERHLVDLRSRMKAVRALISADPTIQHTLATCPEKAAAFYAIHGVTEAQVKRGVPDVDVAGLEGEQLAEVLRGHFPGVPSGPDWVDEEAQRAAAVLPGSGMEVAVIPAPGSGDGREPKAHRGRKALGAGLRIPVAGWQPLRGLVPSPRTRVRLTYHMHRPTIWMLPRIVVNPEWHVRCPAGLRASARIAAIRGLPWLRDLPTAPSQDLCQADRSARDSGPLPRGRDRLAPLRCARRVPAAALATPLDGWRTPLKTSISYWEWPPPWTVHRSRSRDSQTRFHRRRESLCACRPPPWPRCPYPWPDSGGVATPLDGLINGLVGAQWGLRQRAGNPYVLFPPSH
ncbi:MAG: hypothetical protein M1143_00580 [Candidatus Thermoplasmatota archaeon]|nr:hypothetical protein [Candidatus Thermoplasmatota archaeon]